MSGAREPILFEAVSRPPAPISARGLRWLCVAAGLAALLPGLLLAWLGAWPVLPFLGVEVALVLAGVALHRAWRRRAVEEVRLSGGRLLVRRADGRGRRESAEIEAYWASVVLEERAGAVPVLSVGTRGRRVEIGCFLAAEEKRALAAALREALARYRSPVFDNEALRG